jgi:hypothetical protein
MTQTPESNHQPLNEVHASDEPGDGQPNRPGKRAPRPAPIGGHTGMVIALVYVLCAVAAVAGIVIGAEATSIPVDDATLLVISSVSLFFLFMLLPIALALQGQRKSIDLMQRQQDEVTTAVRNLAEQAALSDDARRVINRRLERDLLRRAIEEDIAAEDWDAAAVLCAELADQFGYRADAEELRRQIDRARFRTVERDVANAIAEMDTMLAQHNWAEASVAAIRIGRMYPESPSVEGLRHRVERVRNTYRTELEQRFMSAVDEERPEDALDILEELDAYLTEAEAAPLVETARGVIGKAKEMLGARFKAAVHEQNLQEASAIGDRIMARFPNSRMSHEVADILTTMQQRTPG